MSTLTPFLLEPGYVEFCFFLYQTVADFEHGLDSILTDSIETLELEVSFDKPDVVTS